MKITCFFHARRYHAHLIFYWCLYDKKINLTPGWCMILFSTERLHRKFECTTVCPANHSILRQSSGIHHPHIHLGCTTSKNEKLSVFLLTLISPLSMKLTLQERLLGLRIVSMKCSKWFRKISCFLLSTWNSMGIAKQHSGSLVTIKWKYQEKVKF